MTVRVRASAMAGTAAILCSLVACSETDAAAEADAATSDASSTADGLGADAASDSVAGRADDTAANDGAATQDGADGTDADAAGDGATTDDGATKYDAAGGGAGGSGGSDASADADAPCEPSAAKPEVCNGEDDDCDGQTDEGAQLCDDGNVCTTDESCAQTGATWGCVSTPVDGPCDDNDICTGGEACSGGVCSGGFVSACNDMNECTTDSCDSSGSGCTHEPIPGCGLPCTMGTGECPKPNYCDALVPLTCSGAGRCTLKPDTCTGEVKPVCGCDNQTYSNACLAGQASVPVQSVGACPK